MIKSVQHTSMGPRLILGLTARDMADMMDGGTCLFNTEELGLEPLSIVVMGGPSEQQIADDLRISGAMAPLT